MVDNFQRVDRLSDIQERVPTFLAIGVFDGVHRGHQHLLQEMVANAKAADARPAVLTFFPHPTEVILGLEGRLYLTTLERRVALLAAQGVELVIVHPFDETVRKTRARSFVERLCQVMALRQLWGGSFSLGYEREGNAEFLSALGQEKGFSVHLMQELVQWNGERVSSSRIRKALAEGDMVEVRGCLGRPFCVAGEVMLGDQRGRMLGFPTANLDVWKKHLLPANGVYATYATLNGERYPAATNVGVRPTVDDRQLLVEAHLLDFEREIYGETISLDFIARVRDERKFPNLEALTEQIRVDVAAVRHILSG